MITQTLLICAIQYFLVHVLATRFRLGSSFEHVYQIEIYGCSGITCSGHLILCRSCSSRSYLRLDRLLIDSEIWTVCLPLRSHRLSPSDRRCTMHRHIAIYDVGQRIRRLGWSYLGVPPAPLALPLRLLVGVLCLRSAGYSRMEVPLAPPPESNIS